MLALDEGQIFRVLYLVVPAMSAFELTTRTRRGDLGSPSMCTYGPLGRSASGLLPVFLLPVGRGSWFSSAADFRFSTSRTLAAALAVVGAGAGRDWPAFDAEVGWCPVSGSSDKNDFREDLNADLQWCGTDPWHFGTDPLTNGSGSVSRLCYFRHWPSRRNMKLFFLLFIFWRYIYIIFQR